MFVYFLRILFKLPAVCIHLMRIHYKTLEYHTHLLRLIHRLACVGVLSSYIVNNAILLLLIFIVEVVINCLAKVAATLLSSILFLQGHCTAEFSFKHNYTHLSQSNQCLQTLYVETSRQVCWCWLELKFAGHSRSSIGHH